jgi:hypothetical protein
MEGVFRGQRAAAPVALTAKVMTAFRSLATVCRARGGCVLRVWGKYFREGNAAAKFCQADDYVVRRPRSLVSQEAVRNLRAGQVRIWTEEYSTGTAGTGSTAPSAIRKRRSHTEKVSVSRMQKLHFPLKGGWETGPAQAPRP